MLCYSSSLLGFQAVCLDDHPPTPVRRTDGGELTSRGSKSRTRAIGQTTFVPEAGASPFPGYKLIRLRGRGGFATVWEASGPDGKLTALKFMSSHNAQSTVREVRALRAFTAIYHTHLLPIREVWSIPGHIVIGMELADASMLDLMFLYADEFETPIDLVRLMKHMAQTATGLDFLNARKHNWDGRTVGFQHGDIKPNNILLIGDTAKLADYGLATPTTGPKTPCHRHGTIEYVAPEVFQGYAADSSDQFSLAVTYYVLRCGSFPYPPPPQPETLSRGFTRPAPDLSQVTTAERPALLRALSPIPQNRFPNCSELVNALSIALGLKAGPPAIRAN
jgi:serine/threonine protein kinase, bacterial